MTPLNAANEHIRIAPGDREGERREPAPLLESDFSEALLAVGGVAGRALVCRTQRRVRQETIEMMERRQRARHGIGLAILGFSLLLLVLTPVVWSGTQLHLGWQHFSDSEMQSVYMIGWLFPVTITGLVLGFLRTRASGGPRRIDHRVASRLDSVVR